MKKKRVLLDMDGIIADMHKHWINLYNTDNNTNYTIKDWTPELLESDPTFKTYYLRDGFFKDLEIVPGSVSAVNAMLELGLDVHICSSPSSNFNSVPDKANWLYKNFPQLSFRKWIFTSAKHAVVGDYLIDDAVWNLRDWKRAHPYGKAITISYPWNLEIQSRCDFVGKDYKDTTKAWADIVSYIKTTL